MKLSIRLAIFAFALSLFTGCSKEDTHERVINDAASQMERMANSLSTVKDKATAEKAGAELAAIANDLKAIATRARALGQPPVAIRGKLEGKLASKRAELEAALRNRAEELKKADPATLEALKKAITELEPKFEEVGKIFASADKS